MLDMRIFVTGGTFDKEYNEITGNLFFRDTHIEQMLSLGRCRPRIPQETLMMVDSLDMTPTDREIIVRACRQAKEERLIITHGTDTMVETAQVIAAAAMPKTIVLTGAMVPFHFGSSDGLFNLGSAIAFAQVLPHGVYIAMNGCYFPWDRVQKNKEEGRFVFSPNP